MASPLLLMEAVRKTYPDSPEPLEVLNGVDLALEARESVAIVGPSGCGKSTLLHLAGALDRPTSGHVVLDGCDLATMNDRELAHLRNRELGFVFQLHHLLPQCSVLENVLVPAMAGGGGDDVVARAKRLLERVGLSGRSAHLPGQLSGGERQRAAVVRALINRPRILLADEPTGSLNQSGAEELAQLLLELNSEEELTLLMVTHAEDVAAMMGRILELREGALRERTGQHA